jgi:hypothetical protein
MDKIYKLIDEKTGLFLHGGSSIKFTKNGKTWKIKGHLINHLLNAKRNILLDNMHNWKIIEYELTPKNESDLFEFLSKGDPQLELDLLSNNDKRF